MSPGIGARVINWFKFIRWLYSRDGDDFVKVTLVTGETFYMHHEINCHGVWNTSFFCNGKSGNIWEMRKYVTDPVYFEMSYWRK